MGINIHWLKSARDERGDSFHVPDEIFDFLGGVSEMHFVTLVPGAVRGNHYHIGRKEFIFAYFTSPWRLAWRSKDEHTITTREFSGEGGVIVSIDSAVVHAVKNTGDTTLYLVSCSDAPYTAADTVRESILE